MTETQGSTTERCATNGVDKCHLDDLAQRKHVKIHVVHRGNKWMGSLDLETSNKRTTSQTAGRGLKMEQDNNETSSKAKTSEARCTRLLGT